MMIHKIYATPNENNVVTSIFSDAFQTPEQNDICVAQGSGINYVHISNKYQVVDANMRYNYKLVGNQLVERTEEEKKDDSIESVRYRKVQEISDACKNTIYSGTDVETSYGMQHFSLTLEDQTNISYAYESVKSGTPAFPYHADGEVCKMYSADDIKKISEAVTKFKLYHTTYCNHLNTWIRRATTVDELSSITYGVALPEDLLENFNKIINASAQVPEGNEGESTTEETKPDTPADSKDDVPQNTTVNGSITESNKPEVTTTDEERNEATI